MSAASTPSPLLPPAVRVAVGAAGAAVLGASVLAGVLPPAAGAVLLLLQVAATVAGVLAVVPRRGRQVASWLVLAVTVAVAARVGDVTAPATLALLAGGLVVGQNLLLERSRDAGVALVTVGGTAVLVLSREPGVAPLPALAVAWVAGVVTVALLRRPASGDRSDEAVTPALAGATRRLAWPLAASLVAATVVGLLGLAPPSTAPDRSRAGAGGAFAGPSTGLRSPADEQANGLDMRQRGPLPDWPVMQVPSGSDRLWRTGVLATYTGVSWYPLEGGPLVVGPDDPLGLGDVDPDSPATGTRRTDAVTVLDGLWGGLAVPGHAVGLRADAPLAPARLRGQLLTSGRTWGYEVDSLPVRDAADAAVESGDDPSEAVWTSLPDGVTDRTRALAREVTAGARTRAEVVAAVEAHLRSSYTYDLRSPVPPDGQDAVDHFLFDARTGFCEQFAAAEVVMLRSLGVPARMATGYSGGRDLGDGRRLVTADVSHAWVEVWQPGTGWAPSDPTPAAGPPSAAQAVADWFRDAGNRRLVAVVLVVLFAAAAVVAAVLRRRARPEPVPVRPPDPLLDAVERLLPALELVGRPSPPHETVAALSQRLPELAEPLAVVERAAYGPRPPRWREAAQARDGLDAYRARLLAEAAQRARAPREDVRRG